MNDAKLLEALAGVWRRVNHDRFRRALRPPRLTLSDSRTTLGQWRPLTRTIALSTDLVHHQPWRVVEEVLAHEMAHQYVHEVLGVTDEPPHGPAFQRVCRDAGISADATGLPHVDGEDPRVLRRIRKLLALATSDNRHEAEAAMRRAHRLMLEHNIETADAGARFDFRQIGPAKLRFFAWEKAIWGLLGRHFFVQIVSVPVYLPQRDRWGTTAEAIGTPENLDLAEHVEAWLRTTALRLWAAHKRNRKAKDRNAFLTGVILGFSEKLSRSAREAAETGLVWTGDPALAEYQTARYPRLRAARRTSIRVGSAYRAGRAEGEQLVLHRPIRASARRTGRLLTD